MNLWDLPMQSTFPRSSANRSSRSSILYRKQILELHSDGGKDFILLKVICGAGGPLLLRCRRDQDRICQNWNESVPADANRLRQLVLKGSGKPYDSLPSGYMFSELSFTKLRSVYKSRTGTELTDPDFISFWSDGWERYSHKCGRFCLRTTLRCVNPACFVPAGTVWIRHPA